MSAKQPTKTQVLNAAHILENFAKKGMVGYSQPTIEGGKRGKSKAKPKAKASKAKPKAKAAKKTKKTAKRK